MVITVKKTVAGLPLKNKLTIKEKVLDNYILVWYYEDSRIIEIVGKKKRIYFEWDWQPLFGGR